MVDDSILMYIIVYYRILYHVVGKRNSMQEQAAVRICENDLQRLDIKA